MSRTLTRTEIQQVADGLARDFDTEFVNVQRAIKAEIDIVWPSVEDMITDVDRVVEVFHFDLEQESYYATMENGW